MSNASQIAKLETLLARVVARRNEPRTMRSVQVAPVSSAATAQPVAPVVAKPAVVAPPPTAQPVAATPAPSTAAVVEKPAVKPPQPPLTEDDFESLNEPPSSFVMPAKPATPAPVVQAKPAAAPAPPSRPDSSELDLGPKTATPRVMPLSPAETSIELETSGEDLEVDHTPHVSVLPPRPLHNDEEAVELESIRPPPNAMPKVLQTMQARRPSSPRQTVPLGAPAPPSSGPETYAPRTLPREDPVEVQGSVARGLSFRLLVHRSLSVRWKP